MRMVKAVRTGECEIREGEEDEVQPCYASHYVCGEDWGGKMGVREAGKCKHALDVSSQFFISTLLFVHLFCSPLFRCYSCDCDLLVCFSGGWKWLLKLIQMAHNNQRTHLQIYDLPCPLRPLAILSLHKLKLESPQTHRQHRPLSQLHPLPK
jgi:hypothetical protein